MSRLVMAGVFSTGALIGAAKADVAPAPLRAVAYGPATDPAAQTTAPLAIYPQPIKPALAPVVLRTAPAPVNIVQAPAIAFEEPLPGHEVNSPFGVRALSFEEHARVHEGVDIAAPIGTPIHATAAGEVVREGVSGSYGRFVEVEHADGISSFYAHMSRSAGLKEGDQVASGEVVGYVGSTGHSTGPHLHFEIRKDGEHYNPQMFMGRAFETLASLPLVQSAENAIDRSKLHFAHRGGRAGRHLTRFASHGGRVHHVYSGGGGLKTTLAVR